MDTALTRVNNNLGRLSLILMLISVVLLLVGNYNNNEWKIYGSWFFMTALVILMVLFILFGIDAYLQFRAEKISTIDNQ